jgi:hypothetical protein
MSSYQMAHREKTARSKARQRILQKANTHRLYLRRHYGREAPLTLLTARHIQRAVNIVRQNDLVDLKTLDAAGYRGSR